MRLRIAITDAGRDLAYGFRTLLRHPRYASMVVLTMAVCIGVNSAVFSIVDSVLLSPLPTPDSDALVLMGNRYPRVGAGEVLWSAGGDYVDRQQAVTTLQSQALFQSISRTLESEDGAERLPGMEATPSLFQTLRVSPQIGRVFDQSEGEVGNHEKIILSHALWQRLFGGDPKALGREVRFNGRPHEIVGVMPQGFLFFDAEVSFWIPLALTERQKQAYHSNNWFHIGRLQPGASIEQVQAQVDALNAANLERFPEMREVVLNAGFETRVIRLRDHLVRDIKPSLHLLWGGAGLLLLIGALNAAGLIAARSSASVKEWGTRLALGASLGRLARQIATENVALALVGGALGLGLAAGLVASLGALRLGAFPRAAEVAVNFDTAVFALATAVFAGLFIAAFTCGHLLQLGLGRSLTDSGRSVAGGRHAGLLRKGLVVSQVGLTFVVMTSAALLLASFWELLEVEPGYAVERVWTATTAAPRSRYPGQPELSALTARSLEAVRALPGVKAAGAVSAIPLSGSFIDSVILAEGYFLRPGESVISPIYLEATPGYFEAMSIELLEGRDFDARDTPDSEQVVIIDEGLAERFWPGADPIGRRMYQPTLPDLARVDEHTNWLTVIGVVERVRMKNLAGTDNEAGAYYLPFSQSHPRNFTYALAMEAESPTPPSRLRSVFAEMDPTLALFDIRTMAERASSSLATRRSILTLLLGFGGVSLFLAAVGVYGVLSYLLVQRRREVGIRMAVGCTPAGVFWLFLQEGAMLVGIGVLGGLGAAALGQRALEGLLYGVRPLEPVVIALVILLLTAISFMAVVAPAWGAARTDPSRALSEQ